MIKKGVAGKAMSFFGKKQFIILQKCAHFTKNDILFGQIADRQKLITRLT